MALSVGGLKTLRVLSQKAYGRVYLAQDEQGARYALKELLFALVPATTELDAFEREGAMLRALDHPQVPRFARTFREGTGAQTRLYLAQRFVEGETLQARVGRQPLTEEEAWSVAEQVLTVLVHLHGRAPPVLHRDIKPANLVLGEQGAVTLVDFGAARALAREQTHGATLVGTFGYMPPEQLGGTIDASADLYSLGATLVHALSGRPPSELMSDGMRLDFEPHVKCSRAMRAFLRRLVAPRRADRLRSAEQALRVVRARSVTAAPGRRFAVLPWAVALLAGLAVVSGAALAWSLTSAPQLPDLPVVEAPPPYIQLPQGSTPPPAEPEIVNPMHWQSPEHRHFRTPTK